MSNHGGDTMTTERENDCTCPACLTAMGEPRAGATERCKVSFVRERHEKALAAAIEREFLEPSEVKRG